MTLKEFLVDRIDIFRVVETGDRFGGTQKEHKKVAFNIPARYYNEKGTRRVEVEGRFILPTLRVVVDESVDIRNGDSVRSSEGEEKSYKVVFVDSQRLISRVHHIECDLIEQTFLVQDSVSDESGEC